MTPHLFFVLHFCQPRNRSRRQPRWQRYAQLSRSPLIINTSHLFLVLHSCQPHNRLRRQPRWQPYAQLSRSPLIINTHQFPLLILSRRLVSSPPSVNSIPSTSLSITESLSNLFIQPTTNPQLPSPITPSRSPLSLPLQPPSESAMFRSNLVPIRGFVHEVLRRSRTSGAVLQIALCYLEAIRSKVPACLQRERDGTGARTEPDLADCILSPNPIPILPHSLTKLFKRRSFSPMTHSSVRDNPLRRFPLSLSSPHRFSVPGEPLWLPSNNITRARTEPDHADRIMVQPPRTRHRFSPPAHESHPTTLLSPNDSLKRLRQPSPPLPLSSPHRFSVPGEPF